MIDAHCHFEQKDYNLDREEVIASCRKELKAVINSCCHLDDYKLGMDLRKRHADFLFLALGLHPSNVKEFSQEDIENTCSFLRKNKEEISAVGEIGLDYYWVKEKEGQQKQ